MSVAGENYIPGPFDNDEERYDFICGKCQEPSFDSEKGSDQLCVNCTADKAKPETLVPQGQPSNETGSTFPGNGKLNPIEGPGLIWAMKEIRRLQGIETK